MEGTNKERDSSLTMLVQTYAFMFLKYIFILSLRAHRYSLEQDDGVRLFRALSSHLTLKEASEGKKKAELQKDTRANQPVWELLKYPFN